MNTKTKLLALAAILLLACLLFAEDDICNMELVSTWNSPPAYGISNLDVEIAIKDSIIFFTNSEKIYLLQVSDSGHINLVDSLPVQEPPFLYIYDSLLFTYSDITWGIYVYDVSNPLAPESLTFVDSTYLNIYMTAKDTIIFIDGGYFYNIANPESISFIGNSRALPYYFDFDSMLSYETDWVDNSVFPDPPGTRIESFFRLRKFVGYDSSYVLLDTNLWGGEYLGIAAGNLAVKDTLVFIYGPPGCISVCSITRDGSRITEHNTFNEFGGGDLYKMEIVDDSLLYMCHGNGIAICKINNPPSLTLVGKYLSWHHTGMFDFCVSDSLIYTIRKTSDSLAIWTLKFPGDTLDQCSFNYEIPKQFEFETSPNPFNSRCYIKYSLFENEKANLSIFDLNGQKIEDQYLEASSGFYSWNAEGYPSGIYLIQLTTETKCLIKKVIYIA